MASDLAGPLALTGLLALAIVVLTLRHKPWKNQYGAPTWDFSTSFAMNLAVLAGAVNAFLQLAVGGVSATAKSQALMEAAVFAIVTASAPLLGAIWKAPGGKIYFAGVVAAVPAAATGAFGQVQVLLQLLSPATKSTDGFRATLYFADAAVFGVLFFHRQSLGPNTSCGCRESGDGRSGGATCSRAMGPSLTRTQIQTTNTLPGRSEFRERDHHPARGIFGPFVGLPLTFCSNGPCTDRHASAIKDDEVRDEWHGAAATSRSSLRPGKQKESRRFAGASNSKPPK